ncbi:YqeB family protein [Longispora albida]|uniref:YqeB family protein n=1 Tax=Longispora albida TaxID=203523 RepID=UPI000382D7DE|nr:hypothetical protein [Longispora albida]
MFSDDSTGTVVAEPAINKIIIWGVFPALGAVAGWLLTLLAQWMTTWPWAPFQGPAKLISSLPEPGRTLGGIGVGLLAGVVLGLLAAHESLTVRVAVSGVDFLRGGKEHHVPRQQVHAVFLDGKQVVVLGPGTAELARETGDLPADALAGAFTRHGYPWLAGGDPHHAQFRRWAEGMDGLPAGADALLKARQKALGKSETRDAAELRAELARLGVVVREEKKRQYWRLIQG